METGKIRMALSQTNFAVGDLQGNRNKIIEHIKQAGALQCDVVAFPELCLTGYPPEDLLYRQQFISDQITVFNEICQHVSESVCVLGMVDSKDQQLYNTAAIIENKKHKASYYKINLPNYSVFDEQRYFTSGNTPMVLDISGLKIGLSVCEDIWIPNNVCEVERFAGHADMLLNISASPYYTDKPKERFKLLQSLAQRTQATVVYVNLVGGQDELVFDGQSIVMDKSGKPITTGAAFEEDFIVFDLESETDKTYQKSGPNHFKNPFQTVQTIKLDHEPKQAKIPLRDRSKPAKLKTKKEIYLALCLGLQDYVHKNGFEKVTLGLSGGIDSALVSTIAVDALGQQNVKAVSMPSQYSSQASIEDAKKLAENLGVQLFTFSIKSIFDEYFEHLAETFSGLPSDITEENLQARIRGNILMALSNKFGWLVLATGNKSEISVGYCTIYGDMAGGFSPLKDVFKTMVYTLCHERNKKAGFDLIPNEIIKKPPSAELKPDQTDQDRLPPYDTLDKILDLYITEDKSQKEIIKQGFDSDTVRDVIRLVDTNEYKRRQAAQGTKITSRAFGKDRRLPISNQYFS
jgi:NAD+ synthase (glutamine-hydrolysing)